MSQETHAGQWLGFRQPVLRVAREKRGETGRRTRTSRIPAKCGRRAEFWIALSLEDRSGRIARHPQVLRIAVPARRADHDRRVLRLDLRELGAGPAGGRREGRASRRSQYMRSTASSRSTTWPTARRTSSARRDDTSTTPGVDRSTAIASRAGFNTPSRKLEFYSPTLAEWGWPEHAIPRYVAGPRALARSRSRDEGEFDLLPNFRLPTLIHTRSPVKWLYEISHNNPLWIATADAAQLGIATGDLVKVKTRHRLLRHARVGHRRHPARRRRHVASPRALAAERGSGRRARRVVARAASRDDGRPLRDAAGPRRAAVREQRPRQRARLVERDRRAPEPDVPGAARSGQRHALLAPARDGSRRPAPTTATATSSSTRTSRIASTRNGWRRRVRRPGPTARDGRCGSTGRSSRRLAHTKWRNEAVGQ